MQAGLAHKSEQAHCLEGDCLAAGVGAGYNQQGEILSQCHGDGYYLAWIQQWMASFPDADAPLLIQNRTACIHGKGQCPFCKDKVQIGQKFVVVTDLFYI